MSCKLFTVTFKKLKKMNTNNYLPFDLETALKHPERVVTRDGENVTQLHLFDIDDQYPLFAVTSSSLLRWAIDGDYDTDDDQSIFDLFLLPESNEPE